VVDEVFYETLFLLMVSLFLVFDQDAKEGDSFDYFFNGETTELRINHQVKRKAHKAEWGKALLGTWIGSHPPTEELKRGLLGEKP
jgi:Chalcone isomerase-like